MNILEALVQLRDDLKTWCINNFNNKLNKNLGTARGNKFLITNEHGEITTADISITTDELNYMDGVTSNVQTQIDSKADKATTLAGYGITDAASQSSLNAVSSTVSTLSDIVAEKADINHNHNDMYDAKGSAEAVSTDMKATINAHNISDSAHSDIRTSLSALETQLDNFLGVDGDTVVQLSEVIALIDGNKDTLESLTTSKINVSDIVDNLTTNDTSKVLSASQGVIIQGLIDTLQNELDSHGHEISEISNLQTVLDGKAASEHGIHVSYSEDAPTMSGTASAGFATTVARSDHTHPTDTTRAAQADLNSHTTNTTIHITATERSSWNTAATTASSALTKADAAATQTSLNSHTNNTTAHITANERSKWDTAATTASSAYSLANNVNQRITYGVKDYEAGVTPLNTGVLYFVYEAADA